MCTPCLFLYIHLSFGSIFCIWEKTSHLRLSKSVLCHLTYVLQFHSLTFKSHSIFLPYGCIKLHWYIHHIFLIHSSVVEHLCCFHNLAVMNSAAINIGVKVSLLYPELHSFEYMPKSGITGSYGSSIFTFLKDLHTSYYNIMVVLIYILANSI
jgi:hypothetical protein